MLQIILGRDGQKQPVDSLPIQASSARRAPTVLCSGGSSWSLVDAYMTRWCPEVVHHKNCVNVPSGTII